ncbi:MAG TPA: P-II family nitrogen regulator [Methylomusa anaerophila]|uniref:Nitrogen regulatory protein P-II n=1 Tax=Methylomusa anaerophila TaxID=1930071 RepID=A0A348AMN2_9FIRM|nr:P-II family nitrogen regulator [Methylomusa anaerophila]BBB92330.1 nitrogen regulatory protein P-II [Methylomusa anaerophila]HML90030.1 P-II family nitrogen regulator [Methylomusa anaerophila]
MRKVEAIIRPHKLNEIKDGLSRLGIRGMTVSEVFGYGLQKGHIGIYRGKQYNINILPKVKIEIVALAADVDDIIDIIIKKGQTGEIGDGKIFVLPVEQVYRIRTGESGKAAL